MYLNKHARLYITFLLDIFSFRMRHKLIMYNSKDHTKQQGYLWMSEGKNVNNSKLFTDIIFCHKSDFHKLLLFGRDFRQYVN